MSFSALTKTTAQQSPYFYRWLTDTGGVTVAKYVGTTTLEFRGNDDTDAVAKINAHEGFRDQKGKNPHD